MEQIYEYLVNRRKDTGSRTEATQEWRTTTLLFCFLLVAFLVDLKE